jgi:hypothetical protein
MKTLLGELNAEVGRKDIFKSTSWNDSLHKNIDDNGVRVLTFAKSKNLTFKSTMFPQSNICKNT